MAWLYGVSICTSTEWAARSLVDKYQGQIIVFNDRSLGRFGCSVVKESDGWYCDIVIREVTESGLAGDGECQKANEFCNIFYGMLRNDEYFDFALLGCEVFQSRTMKELEEDFLDKFVMNLDGLVVSKALWDGRYSVFIEFSKSHVWIPKKEEMAR
jgi:hypothetical protein